MPLVLKGAQGRPGLADKTEEVRVIYEASLCAMRLSWFHSGIKEQVLCGSSEVADKGLSIRDLKDKAAGVCDEDSRYRRMNKNFRERV